MNLSADRKLSKAVCSFLFTTTPVIDGQVTTDAKLLKIRKGFLDGYRFWAE
jgi:hypothetical protein